MYVKMRANDINYCCFENGDIVIVILLLLLFLWLLYCYFCYYY